MQGQSHISALLIALLCTSSSFACLFWSTRIVLHVQDVEKGLDVYGTLTFLVTCSLSFLFFQCPSSPPTLSCPQAAPPSLWALTWGNGEVGSFWDISFSGLFLPERTAALGKVSQSHPVNTFLGAWWGAGWPHESFSLSSQPKVTDRGAVLEELSISKTNEQALLDAAWFTAGLEERRRKIAFQALQRSQIW